MSSLHIAAPLPTITVRYVDGIGVVADFGLGSLHLDTDTAHGLVDSLRDALRAAAADEIGRP
ncbi:hypothetical protein [Rhodococcus ruber]|uniref:hypothetical protein n=1 Tax=Rhodococcus ruber TaxID=1830 RepID=UPI00378367A1